MTDLEWLKECRAWRWGWWSSVREISPRGCFCILTVNFSWKLRVFVVMKYERLPQSGSQVSETGHCFELVRGHYHSCVTCSHVASVWYSVLGTGIWAHCLIWKEYMWKCFTAGMEGRVGWSLNLQVVSETRACDCFWLWYWIGLVFGKENLVGRLGIVSAMWTDLPRNKSFDCRHISFVFFEGFLGSIVIQLTIILFVNFL